MTTQEASDIVKMASTTVVSANAFLASVGLLKRTDAGAFMPCAEVIDFLGAYEWDKKTASHKLGPKLRETWFAQALLPRISFGDPLDEKTALTVLSEAAGNIGPEYESELRMLLEYLVFGGLVQRDGGQVKQVAKGQTSPQPPSVSAEPTKSVTPEPADSVVRTSRVSAGYAAQAGGGVDFNVNVQVDMAEFGTWHPDRIAAFFKGIALVLAAKAGIEKETATS